MAGRITRGYLCLNKAGKENPAVLKMERICYGLLHSKIPFLYSVQLHQIKAAKISYGVTRHRRNKGPLFGAANTENDPGWF